MPTQGPAGPSTMDNDASAGSTPWADPDNAKIEDGFYATYDATFSFDDVTQYLHASNIGFFVPAGATIDGIQVDVKRKTNSSGLPVDNSIKLFKSGSVHGSDKSVGAAWTETSDTYVTFGGPSDRWGGTWTVSDINSSGFGFGYSVADPSTGGWIAFVNHIQITVTYTEAAGGVSSQTLTLMGVG